MGSHAMHICVSSKIKDIYNLSDKFILGSILPDLLKRINNDRRGTHYTKDILLVNNSIKRLPDLERFKRENKDELEKGDEETLGYFAHLIEDYIWFDKYVSRYIEFKVGESKYVYMYCKNSMCEVDLWVKAIYNDYAKNEKYIFEKSDFERENIKQRLKNIVTDQQIKDRIEEEIIQYPIDLDAQLQFLTQQQIDEYFEDCIREIKNQFKSI